MVFLTANGDHFLRLPELRLQRADVLVNLVVLDDVAVDLGEGRIAVRDAAQRDDELQEIGVGLLPERFLRFPEQVVQQRGDGIRHRIGIEIVVQRVVADAGVEADLEVIVLATRLREHGPDLVTEVAFDLQDEAAEFAVGIVGPPAQELIRHTDTCTPRSSRSRPRPAIMTPV